MEKGGRPLRKTAIITGGAGGLGLALAAQLQTQGWFTVLIDLPGPSLEGLPSNDMQMPLACDLTDQAQLIAVCDKVRQERPSIDMVIYSAGVTQIGLFENMDLATQRRVFDINYFAAVAMAREVLADIRRARGAHVAISSVAGFSPLFKRSAYAASKHALQGFFTSLRAEEHAHGVRVSIAAPSFVATNPGNPERQDGGIARPGSAVDGFDQMSAQQAAKIILRGVEKGHAFIPVGRVARLAWWVTRLSPALFLRLMMRNMKAGP